MNRSKLRLYKVKIENCGLTVPTWLIIMLIGTCPPFSIWVHTYSHQVYRKARSFCSPAKMFATPQRSSLAEWLKYDAAMIGWALKCCSASRQVHSLTLRFALGRLFVLAAWHDRRLFAGPRFHETWRFINGIGDNILENTNWLKLGSFVSRFNA